MKKNPNVKYLNPEYDNNYNLAKAVWASWQPAVPGSAFKLWLKYSTVTVFCKGTVETMSRETTSFMITEITSILPPPSPLFTCKESERRAVVCIWLWKGGKQETWVENGLDWTFSTCWLSLEKLQYPLLFHPPDGLIDARGAPQCGEEPKGCTFQIGATVKLGLLG